MLARIRTAPAIIATHRMNEVLHQPVSSLISRTLSIDAAMLGAMTTVAFAGFTTARVER